MQIGRESRRRLTAMWGLHRISFWTVSFPFLAKIFKSAFTTFGWVDSTCVFRHVFDTRSVQTCVWSSRRADRAVQMSI